MKKSFLILCAAAAILAAGCNKAEVGPSSAGGSRVSLTVGVGSATKGTVADTDDEAKVNNLQVFVFRGDVVDAYGSIDGESSITLSATTGERTVYALVNCPQMATVSSLAALQETLSSLGRKAGGEYVNKGGDNFEMAGSLVHTIAAADATDGVNVPVDRLAARVKIDKITRDFSRVSGETSALAKLDESKFKITRMYLANAVDNAEYGAYTSGSHKVGAPDSYTWLTSILNGDGSAIATDFPLVCSKLAEAATLAEDASYSTSHSFYCYPNPTTKDGASAKVTRLVIECEIDGEFFTYPILLGMGVQNNRSYQINELVITRLGNPGNGDDNVDEGEDDPIESVEIPFGITVQDWEQVFVTSEGQSNGVVVI